ncbi:hypothetical protein [Celeribacter arenosi]|uniref:DUF2845 domain-containing protein n=1 Tax=Celeribacter arenosi TaxID=792649 RepID=A0ABP7KGM0_9RHOB
MGQSFSKYTLALGLAALGHVAPAIAQDVVRCGALVTVHDVTIAIVRPCETGESYSVASDDFTLTLTPGPKGATLEIAPRKYVFLNGENEALVPLPSEGARLGIFDSFSASYVAEGENDPIGYVTGWSGQ